MFAGVHIEQVRVNVWRLSGTEIVFLVLSDMRWKVNTTDRQISEWSSLNLALAHGVAYASGHSKI